jgi:3-hydroxyisobutyrate dehydrogenase-like beta-hydroxyacid dehydrogenase
MSAVVGLQMDSVGFIGVGIMGGAIAARMVKNGVPVLAYDNNSEVLARLVDRGATAATSMREIIDQCEVVFACLPTADVCRAVALGPNGVESGGKVRIYADLSTMGGATAVELAAALALRGITFMDSPVVGGVIALEAGGLGVVVSGPKAAFERIKPLYEAFAGKVFYLGEQAGMAQVGKVVNNAVGYASLYASFEAVAVGMKAGIDIETCVAIINQGSGANFHTQRIFPAYIIPGKLEGTGAIEIGVKDVKCFLDEARRLGVETPMANNTSAVSKLVADSGPPGRDTMTGFNYFCDLAGVPRRG